jgi:uncharacterized protein (TIGR00251 family)
VSGFPASPPHWLRVEAGRVVLSLHVQPGAKRTEVAGLHGEALKLRLAARAVEGAANAALIQFIAEAFGVPQRQVQIVSGERSREKRVAVEAPARMPGFVGG